MEPTEEARAEAKLNPGGYVYAIEGSFGPRDAVPPGCIKGGWKVDDSGEIVGDFIPNPNYKPLATPKPRGGFIRRLFGLD